jgi:hypothetical protein
VTDHPDSAEPPEIAEVRRLLADVRHTEPMPDDVATRMHGVLARLGDQTPAARSEPSREADVVPIAAHRRRRAAGLLVAAAAIVVGGVAVAPHINVSSSGGSQATASAEDGGDQTHENLGNTGNEQTQPQHAQPSTGGPPMKVRDGLVVVRPQHFATDALQARRRLKAPAVNGDLDRLGCAGVPVHADAAVPAEYQHAPAVLVFRRAEGSSQVVDLYVCGSARPIRSTTLPAP